MITIKIRSTTRWSVLFRRPPHTQLHVSTNVVKRVFVGGEGNCDSGRETSQTHLLLEIAVDDTSLLLRSCQVAR